MDNWREGKRTGHTHEPNDATIQLDGLGRQLAELPGEPVPPDHSDGPVFVDESGRRSKTFRRLGWVLATVCAGYAVTLVLAVLGGNSSAPWLPLSGPKEEAKAEEAEVRPAPSEVVAPIDDSPEPAPSASGSATAPQPGASGGTAPSATSILVPAGSGSRPTASASAAPPSGTGGGGSGGRPTKPAPTTSTAEPPVDPPPPPPEPEPTAGPSEPAESPEPPAAEESAS